ncbi:hypothetical protein QTN25_000201 [Entamoeba marina]
MNPCNIDNISDLMSDSILNTYFIPILKNIQSAFVLNGNSTLQFIQQLQQLLMVCNKDNVDISTISLFKFDDQRNTNPTKQLLTLLEDTKKQNENCQKTILGLGRFNSLLKSEAVEMTKLIIQLRDGCVVAQSGYNEAIEKIEILETQVNVLERVNGLMKNKMLAMSSSFVGEKDNNNLGEVMDFQEQFNGLQEQMNTRDVKLESLQQKNYQLQEDIDSHKREMCQELEDRESKILCECQELFDMIMFEEMKIFQQQLQTLYKNENSSLLFTPPTNAKENMTFITEIKKDYYTLDNNKIVDASKIVQQKTNFSYTLYNFTVENGNQYCEWAIFLGKGIEDNTFLTYEKDVIIVRYKKDLLWKREGNDLVVMVTEKIPKRLTHPTGIVFEYSINKLPLILDGWGFNGGRCIIKKKHQM